jgi:predicted MPP superfamily phosphohydrolase
MILRWIIFIFVMLALQWYSFQALKTVFKSQWIQWIYITVSLIVVLQFIIGIIFESGFNYIFPSLLILVIFQLIIIPFVFIEDITRLFIYSFDYLKSSFNEGKVVELVERRKFISQLAILIASIPVSALLIGVFWGKYNFKIIKHQLTFNNLPDDFDDFTIVHVSDFHMGSFTNIEKVKYGFDLIQKQNADLILFTGDMVNNLASELDSWKEIIGGLSAKYGKYSVLGNHDYGDYTSWDSEDDKIENFNKLKNTQREMGFQLLLNESISIEKNNSKIDLVGVENWGNGFKKNGDLDKALSNSKINSFKILMSHDPSHWEEVVLNHNQHIDLTLSGHTHGMQFGIEIPGLIKWSPAKYKYKHWAGVYTEKNKIINVNRGFGVLAYPGRVGIYPEITVLKLKKSIT